MINKILLFTLLVCLAACSQAPLGDRRLKRDEIPDFLKKYQDPQYANVEFFVKGGRKKKSYEVKYLVDEREVSLAFNKNGNLIEKEEDIGLHHLPRGTKEKILQFLEERYAGYKIIELEKRQENESDHFIDVEIRHKSSPSGYWELSFSEDGDYLSREKENYDFLDTLN